MAQKDVKPHVFTRAELAQMMAQERVKPSVRTRSEHVHKMTPKDFKPFRFAHPELVSRLVSGNTMFAMDLYQELCKAEPGNIFFSPISISVALAMTYIGAANNTAMEMKETLKLSALDDSDLHEAYKDLNHVLQSDSQTYTLKTANQIFARKSYKFLPDFFNATKKYYSAEPQLLDFEHNADQSRAIINKLVEDQTANKIIDLIPDGLINSQIAMVLVNAIYFKGDWMEKFDKNLTINGKFKLGSGGTADIQMMYQQEEIQYGQNNELDCKIVEVPYVHKELSMFIILPNKDDGLPDLERKMTAEMLSKLTSDRIPTKVHLILPRFKLEHSFSVKDMLGTLGLIDMFTPGVADFSKMDGTKEIYVSDVVHKSFIEVNEKGSEAAAATAVICVAQASGCAPVYFNADHPFLFLIRENHSNSILFMGRLSDPK